MPESLAYASIAGVSPVVGLYAAPAVAALERLFASIGRRDLSEALLRWR